MANKKKEVFRPGPMTEGKRNIIQGLLQEWNYPSYEALIFAFAHSVDHLEMISIRR